jgi:hypothetical protein
MLQRLEMLLERFDILTKLNVILLLQLKKKLDEGQDILTLCEPIMKNILHDD